MSVESVRQRLEAATPGPWQVDGPYWWAEASVSDVVSAGADRIGIAPLLPSAKKADADLIAHAPEDLRLALAVVETGKALSAQQDLYENGEFVLEDEVDATLEHLYVVWAAFRQALEAFEAAK